MRFAGRVGRFSFVNSTPVKQIKEQAKGKSVWEFIKAELKVGKLIMSEGYKQAKYDIRYYYKNFSLNFSRSSEVNRRMYEIGRNLWKLPPIALLFCLPGGIPFILGYMALLPALTPTWFLLDTYKQKQDQEKRLKKIEALRYFRSCEGIKIDEYSPNVYYYTTGINLATFQQMSLNQKKRVHELCFGEANDGTNIIRKSFRINLDYLISPTISQFILQKNMERKLYNEPDSIQYKQLDKLVPRRNFHNNREQDKLSHVVLRQANKFIKDVQTGDIYFRQMH